VATLVTDNVEQLQTYLEEWYIASNFMNLQEEALEFPLIHDWSREQLNELIKILQMKPDPTNPVKIIIK